MKYVGEMIGKGIALGGGSAIGHSIFETLTKHFIIEKEQEKNYGWEEKLFYECLKNKETISSCKNLIEHLKTLRS